MKDPEVREFHVVEDEVLIIFQDGARAIFDPFTVSNGDGIGGLASFHLVKGNAEKFFFLIGRVNEENDEESHYIADMRGFDQQTACSYWRAARAYFDQHYNQIPFAEREKLSRDFWYGWRVCGEDTMDYDLLHDGKMEVAE